MESPQEPLHIKHGMYYHHRAKSPPPPGFMKALWDFMERTEYAYCTLTIKNTNLLSEMDTDNVTDTLPVRCTGYVKITDENEKDYLDVVDSQSTYWETREGAYMEFRDEFDRDIPMFVANTAIPFAIVNNGTGERFDCVDFSSEGAGKMAYAVKEATG